MRKQERKIRLTGRILFFAYILVLVYFLFFAEWYQHGFGVRDTYRYNYIPFREIRRFWEYREELGLPAVLLNLFGNVIGFLPVGFFLPVVSRKLMRCGRTVLNGFLLSVLVETVQLVTRLGICDIDDVILNTLGTLIGYILFYCMRFTRNQLIIRKYRKRREKGT